VAEIETQTLAPELVSEAILGSHKDEEGMSKLFYQFVDWTNCCGCSEVQANPTSGILLN